MTEMLEKKLQQIIKNRNGVSWYLSFKQCCDNRSIEENNEKKIKND